MRNPVFALALGILLAGPATAQLERIVAVSGGAQFNLSFELEIVATSLTRTIPFGPMKADFSPAALAALMIEGINDDFRRRGDTGFQARALTKADGDLKIEAGFVISAPTEITEIKIGPSGGAVPVPRAPGVAFNPTFTDTGASLPTPLLGFQGGSPNAALLLNGQDPLLTHYRDVQVPITPAGGSLTLAISTGPNPNENVTLLLGAFRPFDDGVWLTSWGDVLELGMPTGGIPSGLTIVADGIWGGSSSGVDHLFHTDGNGDFSMTVGLSPSILTLPPSTSGFQALVTDPTSLPFCLRFTPAVRPDFGPGRERVLAVPTNGQVPVDFLPGRSFSFYGQTYTQLFAAENGFVTFGAPTSLPNAVVDPMQALLGPPAIFASWADWQISPGDGLRVREFRDELKIAWGRNDFPFGHAGDVDVAAFELTLLLGAFTTSGGPDAGAIRLDWFELGAGATSQNDALVGVSPGMNLDPSPLNLDLGLFRFANQPNGSLLQQDAASQMAASVLPVTAGAAPFYFNGDGWRQRSLTFFPPTGTGPNGTLPHVFADRARPDHVAPFNGPFTLSNSGPPNQAFLLRGYFQYAHDESGVAQAQAILDPLGQAGVGPIALQVGAVAASTAGQALLPTATPTLPLPPGARDFEALQLILPAGGIVPIGGPLPPPLDLLVVFASGLSFTLPGVVIVTS